MLAKLIEKTSVVSNVPQTEQVDLLVDKKKSEHN